MRDSIGLKYGVLTLVFQDGHVHCEYTGIISRGMALTLLRESEFESQLAATMMDRAFSYEVGNVPGNDRERPG